MCKLRCESKQEIKMNQIMYANQNERKRNESQSILICSSLSQSTQTTQQTLIRIRRPTSKYNSINTKSSKK